VQHARSLIGKEGLLEHVEVQLPFAHRLQHRSPPLRQDLTVATELERRLRGVDDASVVALGQRHVHRARQDPAVAVEREAERAREAVGAWPDDAQQRLVTARVDRQSRLRGRFAEGAEPAAQATVVAKEPANGFQVLAGAELVTEKIGAAAAVVALRAIDDVDQVRAAAVARDAIGGVDAIGGARDAERLDVRALQPHAALEVAHGLLIFVAHAVGRGVSDGRQTPLMVARLGHGQMLLRAQRSEKRAKSRKRPAAQATGNPRLRMSAFVSTSRPRKRRNASSGGTELPTLMMSSCSRFAVALS
jgi:hypothetical protein